MIRDLMLVEFNDSVGKRIICSACGLLSDQEFKCFDQVLLPKDELCLRYIAMHLKQFYLLGIPILLRSSTYKREKYLFSPILIVDEGQFSQNSHSLYLTAHKISSIFANVEMEQRAVFQNRMDQLQTITDKLFRQINSVRVPALFWHKANIAFFRQEVESPAVNIANYSVLQVKEKADRSSKGRLNDLLSKGYCSLHKIAMAEEEQTETITARLMSGLRGQQILAHGYFDFENRYELTPLFCQSNPLQKLEVMEFCKMRRGLKDKQQYQTEVRKLLKTFFLKLNRRITIGNLARTVPNLEDIYLLKLLRWAIKMNFVRQVQQVFVCQKQQDLRPKIDSFITAYRKDQCKDEKTKEAKISRVQKLLKEGVMLERLCVQFEASKSRCIGLLDKVDGYLLYL